MKPHHCTSRGSRLLAARALAGLTLACASFLHAQVPTFNTFVSTPKGGEPWFQPAWAAVADYNGDGKLDALIADGSYASEVRLMLGNGNGSFGQSNVNVSAPPTNPTPGMIRSADLNGDGQPDAVFVSPQGNLAPTVMLNNGNNGSGIPQFSTTTYTPAYSGLRSLTVGDLNGDSRPDFIVGNAYGNLYVYLNNGNGTFTAGQTTNLVPNVGGSTGPGVIADLNGDGQADYAVTSNQAGAINVFFGNGDGTLQSPVVMPSSTTSLAVADVNSDGRPDLLAVANGAPNQLQVYLNTGGGSFGAPAAYPTGGTAFNGWTSVTTADLNGDGKLDVVAANSGNNNVAVFLGDGSGTFGAPVHFAVNQAPFDVAVRDFTGDGKPDIATVGHLSRTYDVLTNTTVFAPPLPTQTLTILGGSGSAGGIAADVEYYNPATGNWQPAYLTGGHPWGFVTGTNSWINYKTGNLSDPGAGPTTNQTLWYLYRVRFTVPADALDPKMTFSLKADNFAQVAINGVTAGGSTQYINNTNVNNVIVGQADQVNVDAAFSQNVQVGENTITLNIGDWGGLNGFNFRIDLSMKASGPIEIVPVDTDNTPPVITTPGNLTREATGPAGAAVTFATSALDDVDGPVPTVAIPPSGSTFPLDSTTVDVGATDSAGNQAFTTFTVTVRDTTPPVISAPADLVAEATSAAGAAVSYSATAADLVDGARPISGSPASGAIFALGPTTVALSSSDTRGNSSSASFTVTVQDTLAPALVVPANQVLEATGASGATATFSATATDAVGVASVIYSPASGSTFPLGTTPVTITARDAAGNTTTGSFTITVRDTAAPVISSLTNSAPTLWPPNHKMVAVTVSAGANDLVGVSSLKIISVTSNEPDNGLGDGDTAGDIQITGDLTVNLRAERSGKGNGRVYTITVEARDAAGNASTRTTTVTVPKSQGK